jgi:hypothetical protein
MTIQRDESKLWTTSEMVRQVSVAIRKLSEYEKAKLRVSLRQRYNLPPVRERALEN